MVQFEDSYQGMPLGMPHIGKIEEQAFHAAERHGANWQSSQGIAEAIA